MKRVSPSDSTQPAITLHRLSKAYGKTGAVNDASLTVSQGAIVAFLGPSGCGKSTTLRLIAGLEQPDAGEIRINGQQVAGAGHWVEPEARRVGMIFQDYALFPHLTVGANIGYGLRSYTKAERARREEELMALTALDGMAKRYPHQLSGGQQQRVALARALAPQPTLLLMDEPFSNLDASLRVQMREEVRTLVKRVGTTTLLVTHDQQEAFSLADVVVVMLEGRFVQVGAPLEIYLNPVDRTVAAFVGEANFLPGVACGATVECTLGTLPLVKPHRGPVDVLIRPEAVHPTLNAHGIGCIEETIFLGHDQQLRVRLRDGSRMLVRARPHPDWVVGAPVQLTVPNPVLVYPQP